MMEHALMCPQCNAPLSPHRFARSVVCAYCGATVQLDESAVAASRFREAFRIWNDPGSYQVSSWLALGNRHWAVEDLIGRGETSDVYSGRLARWPTELVIIKVLRDRKDAEHFDNEWNALQSLHFSNAPGADTFTTLLPQLIVHGDVATGAFAGHRASIFRWASGFYHTFEDVLRVFPQGIPPQASIWVWRRILELLTFVHSSGMAHGAIVPAHLLVQEGEHGVRLVGYGNAGRFNEKLHSVPAGYESFYPQSPRSGQNLTAQLDLMMSARCIAAILGGDPESASLPRQVPDQLAGIIKRIALSGPDRASGEDAWAIREKLGQISNDVFGQPRFMPIVMP